VRGGFGQALVSVGSSSKSAACVHMYIRTGWRHIGGDLLCVRVHDYVHTCTYCT
jgi:hypothetical protein